MHTVDEVLEKDRLSRDDMLSMLSLSSGGDIQKLYDAAYRIKRQYVGSKVYFRGLIEFSNICDKN